MPEGVTWADLPLEILEQILTLCDAQTLLSLSYLNTQLNTVALDLLLRSENVTNPRQGYFVSRLAPPEIIPALNAALWLNHLPHITYYLNPDVKRLYSEIRGLDRLVSRLPKNGRLDLYFSSVDRWFSDYAQERKTGELTKIDPVVWGEIFVHLLETALSKGCLSMRVEGGHRLHMYFMDDPVLKAHQPSDLAVSLNRSSSNASESLTVDPISQPAPRPIPVKSSSLPIPASLRKKVTRWFRKRLKLRIEITPASSPPTSTITTPIIQITPAPPDPLPAPADPEPFVSTNHAAPVSFQTSTPCLKTLNLRSSMMLHSLFFSHTLNLIHAHSSKLEHLDLVSVKTSKSVWKKFFESITLPVLEVFTYQYDTLIVEEPVITPVLLLEFFTRHPSLRVIELYGVCVGEQGPELEVVEFPDLSEGVLPNLVHLDAHPKIVSWILRSPIACPKLVRVFLSSEYMASRLAVTQPHHNPYDTFDEGIRTISSLVFPPLPPPDPSESTHDPFPQDQRPIHLHFKFSTEDSLLEWFLSHTTSNPTQPSPLNLLKNVSKLTVSAHYHTKFEIDHKRALPRFFGLLPNVRQLELIELPYPEELKDGMFIQDVKAHVKNLERFVIGRSVVWDKEGYEGSVIDSSWSC